jgi:catechol 2,3-dioxygenase-like lactoylglutathione lyase family enzyme
MPADLPPEPPSQPEAGRSADEAWAALVPELLVTDLDRSLAFYCGLCGFRVRYDRPEDGFAYLELGQAEIMLEEVSDDAWQTGDLVPPFGRGMNLQIEVAADWYRDGPVEHGQAQVMVQDPDGYLLRFVQPLGTRPAVLEG